MSKHEIDLTRGCVTTDTEREWEDAVRATASVCPECGFVTPARFPFRDDDADARQFCRNEWRKRFRREAKEEAVDVS